VIYHIIIIKKYLINCINFNLCATIDRTLNIKLEEKQMIFSKVMVVPELMHGFVSWALNRADEDALK
jgi:hypothetical protein